MANVKSIFLSMELYDHIKSLGDDIESNGHCLNTERSGPKDTKKDIIKEDLDHTYWVVWKNPTNKVMQILQGRHSLDQRLSKIEGKEPCSRNILICHH